MTAIVGLVEKGVVYIGGDSAGVAGLSLSVRADRKVFRNGEFIMGFTSSFRMGQLLRYKLKVPAQKDDQTTEEYMVTTFIDAVRTCLKEGGFACKHNEVESGGTFLVGYRGHLFTVFDDFQVAESADNFFAVGCGRDLCLGSLHSTADKNPVERLRLALQAAAKFSGGICPPFHFIESDAGENNESGGEPPA